MKLPCLRWSAGRVPCLHYILTSTLQMRKITVKPIMVPEKCLAEPCQAWLFGRIGRRLHWSWVAAWSQLPSSDMGQPSLSVNICRVAEISGCPHHLTWSRNSQSRLWCDRRRIDLPDPREYSCYQFTVKDLLVAERRHLDWNNCRFLTWERTTDLRMGHASFIIRWTSLL